MYRAVGIEQPGECDIIFSLRRRSEHKIPLFIALFEIVDRMVRSHISEFLVVDLARSVSRRLRVLLLYLEIAIHQVFFGNLVNESFINVLFMIL